MGSRVPLPEPTWKQADNIEDTVATNMDHATGLERSEMLAHMEGRNIFDEHPIGHFGTKENPYIVESIFDERIVGVPCSGEENPTNTLHVNEVKWFTVTAGEPCLAPNGEYFLLKKVEGEAYNF